MKVYVVLANIAGDPDGVTVFAVCRKKERAEQHEHALNNTRNGGGPYFRETVEIELD